MENQKTYVQPWRIVVALFFTFVAMGLFVFYGIYWWTHDELTKMQMFKLLWYVPVGAAILLFLAKLHIEKFKKLNTKKTL